MKSSPFALCPSLDTIFLVVVLVLAPLPASAFTTLTIVDDFQDLSHDLNLSGSTGSLSDSASGGTTILGGRRNIEFTVSTNPLAATAHTTVNIAGNGRLDMSLGSGVTGYTRLSYSGLTGAGLGGLNFTENGHDSLALHFISLNQVTGLNLTVTDVHGQVATLDSAIPTSLPGLNSFSYAFDAFDNAAGTDFSQVDAFAVRFTTDQPGTNFQLESISLGAMPLAAAPEPDRALLLAVSALTLAAHRRRPGRLN